MELTTKNNPQFKQGYLYAVRLLTASKKSRRELAKRLKEKGYPEVIASQILDSLTTQKLLDDQKLIRETIQWAIHSRRYGRRRILLELKRRGIESDELKEAIGDYSRTTEYEVAKSLAQERWEKLNRVEPHKRKKRLYDFLANRGFDFEMCREIVNQLKSESDESV